MNENDLLFCPRCGKPTTKQSENLRICHTCHLKNYINPRPCNAIIFHNKNNDVLMVKRGIDPHKDMWDLPGGFVNFGETLEESMRREIQEELSISAKKIAYFASYTGTYLFENVCYSTLCFIFTAFLDEKNKIQCADDVASYSWFSPKELPFNTIAFEGIKLALKDYFIL